MVSEADTRRERQEATKGWIARMVTASAKDDKDLLDSLRQTDWQRTRGGEVAMMLELGLAFPPRAASELEYPLFPDK